MKPYSLHKLLSLLVLSLPGALLIAPTTHHAAAQVTLDFNRDIRPILSDKCFACHGPDATTKNIKLRLDSEAAARNVLAPGQPEQSKLIQRITHADEARRMPPADSGRTLSPQEIKLLTEWVRQGAKWQSHWSFIAPVRPPLPSVKNTAWTKNAIDYFVLARLEKEGLQPQPEAPRTTLIRRVSLDLTGLPPTPAEVDAFLNDHAPNAYEKVVDRLLASPRYGERMAFRWLDAARYADTNGYQRDDDRYMWRWRDWVIEAFNANKPYDQFTIEQLAGDLLPNPTMEQRLATGFNRNHRGNTEDGIVPEEYAVEYVVDRVDTTATVWLGLTVGCARCHNHKYDPLSQREYYQLYAFFNNIPENGRYVRKGNSPPTMLAPTIEQQAQLSELEKQITATRELLAEHAAQTQAAQKTWEQSLREAQWFPNSGLVANFALEDVDKAFPNANYQPGRLQQAAAFDGSSVLSVDGKPFNFDEENRFTLSAWIYPTSEHAGAILTHATDSGTARSANAGAQMGRGYGLIVENGKLHFNLVSVWADDAIRVETETKLALNEWQHVVASYDGNHTADGVQLFVKGQRQTLKVNFDSVFRPFAINQPLRIGGVGNDKSRQFRGRIDEVRIYDVVVPHEQIAVLANAESLRELARNANRSETQANKLRWAFLDTAAPPNVRQAWQRLNDLQLQRAKLEATFPTSMVMQELSTPRDAFILKRGAYDAPGEKVTRAVPAALPPLPATFSKDRLGLAQWLVHPSNPLTARVTVNRFWQMLFGSGLVKTIEDFGAQGELPSHPELLDWLASEFMKSERGTMKENTNASSLHRSSLRDQRWDVKALLKTIVTSATYRQSSAFNPKSKIQNPKSDDPNNRLLARAPRLRLPAEMIRDQALFAAGLLVEQRGGPSVNPYQPEGLWNDLVFNETKYVPDNGDKLYRRSLYTFWKRTLAPPMMANFDAAGRETCIVREQRTNTPLQALNLMNDVTYVEAARMLAERAMRAGGKTDAERLRYAFRLLTARWPSANELQVLLANLQTQRAHFAKNPGEATRLLKVGDKPYDTALNAQELVAYAAVTSLLLNLDEVITRE